MQWFINLYFIFIYTDEIRCIMGEEQTALEERGKVHLIGFAYIVPVYHTLVLALHHRYFQSP